MLSTKKKTPLLIVNDFHSDTVAKLDASFKTYKLWKLSPQAQHDLIKSIENQCMAVATASWSTNPIIYELPHLKIISCFGVGVDAINFDITRKRSIAVTNTPGVLNDAVADMAIALILMCQRDLINANDYVRDGKWPTGAFPFGHSLAGKTLGILGLGAIGNAIAVRAQSFKLNIAYHNRNQKDVPYKYYASILELANSCDILLNVLPGGRDTRRLIGMQVFQALGSSGVFINIGRGTTVDEKALEAALLNGVIAAAGLDVYENEPHVSIALRQMKNAVLLPHIGSATVETRQSMGQLVLDNLLAWERGESLISPVL
ncbi:MAG: hypothetical protein RLZZ385_481 [Pseudomonadota bacterium]|jgi:lactate dehydrogenase-like 2-hydroxyacid dehydrogenase